MLLIKNGLIHIGNGQILENTDILINNKKIEKIDKNINIKDCEIIDADGKEVFPGFIDPVSHIGCLDLHSKYFDNEESTNPSTPEMNIKYSFNPAEIESEKLYKVGITSIGASPGNTNVINGQMAVFKTFGKNVSEMMVKESAGLKCSVTTSVKSKYGEKDIFPKTKMGIFNVLNSTFKNVDNLDEESKDKETVIKKVLNKEMPVFITANTKAEIDAVINVMEKYDINYIICNAYQANKCILKIKSSKASIVIGEQIYLSRGLNNDTDLNEIANLHKEGKLVSITMTPESYGTGREKYLWNVIELYKAGINSEDVLKMMTIYPAKMLGVDNIIGSIEEDKEADIVIYTNNPIKYYDAKVAYTIIQGKVVYNKGGKCRCY